MVRALVALTLALAAPGSAFGAVPAGNLVQNPGGEAIQGADSETAVVPPPEWGTTSNFTAVRYATTTFPASAPGGKVNFFAGGPSNASSLAEQVIDVSGAGAEIDAGRVSVRLSALLGGFDTQQDNATVTAELEDEHADTTLGTLQVGPVTAADRSNATTLVPRSTAVVVPAGTRRIRVTITATRVGPGSYNDGYADNVAVELTEHEDPPGDVTPPETTITSGPPSGTAVNDTAPTYEFTSDEPGATFECRAYDPGSPVAFNASRVFNPCSSPFTAVDAVGRTGITQFEVRAVDPAGNADSSPAERRVIRHPGGEPPPEPSRCRMVRVDRAHGNLLPGCRLARIRHGEVPCVNVNSAREQKCDFRRGRTGKWLESARGPDFAMVGDSLSRDGDRRGNFIVAAKRSGAETVPCRKPPEASAADTAGRVADGTELAGTCVVEDLGTDYNALSAEWGWSPLLNYATIPVCTRSPDHPDFAEVVEDLGGGILCYGGQGAGLNDTGGTERDWLGEYFDGSEFCHYIVTGHFEVPAAKRPATRSYPAPGSVNMNSPLLWRPVNPNVRIAN
jgi:hypothetical protein